MQRTATVHFNAASVDAARPLIRAALLGDGVSGRIVGTEAYAAAGQGSLDDSNDGDDA